MSYPKLKNKHKHDAFFNPKGFKPEKKPKNFPKKFIFIYYDKLLNYFKRKYKPKKIRLNEWITIYQYKDIGVVHLTGIGCPHAVWTLESLIGKGGRIFLSIGAAGGLQDRGIYLCTKALRDEGTSYHYISHGNFSYPDEKLTNKLRKSIKKLGLGCKEGATWTIDAPYRETKKEVKKYAKKGISTVEMEASALFAVAKFRKVKMASAFVVSDTLIGDEHIKLYDKKDFRDLIKKLLDAAVECLK